MAGCTLDAEKDELLEYLSVNASGVGDKANSPRDRQLLVQLFIYAPSTDKAWFGLVLNMAAYVAEALCVVSMFSQQQYGKMSSQVLSPWHGWADLRISERHFLKKHKDLQADQRGQRTQTGSNYNSAEQKSNTKRSSGWVTTPEDGIEMHSYQPRIRIWG